MIAGAAFLHFVFSSGGPIVAFVIAGLSMLAWPKTRGPRRAFVALAAFYLLASSYPLPHRLAIWLSQPFHPLLKGDVPPGAAAVVLLGSGGFTQEDWAGNRYSVPDPVGAERTLEAVRIFRLVDPAWVVSSGGSVIGGDPDEPPGTIMKASLLQLGVPADRVIVERESRTTREEAEVVRRILPPLGVEHIILVTSNIHMRRSLGVFRASGMDPIPAIAKSNLHSVSGGWRDFLPSKSGLDETDDVVHEMLGLLYYRLRGWLK